MNIQIIGRRLVAVLRLTGKKKRWILQTERVNLNAMPLPHKFARQSFVVSCQTAAQWMSATEEDDFHINAMERR